MPQEMWRWPGRWAARRSHDNTVAGHTEYKADAGEINPDQEHLESHQDILRDPQVEKDGLASYRKGRLTGVTAKDPALAALREIRSDSAHVALLHSSIMGARGIGAWLAPVFGLLLNDKQFRDHLLQHPMIAKDSRKWRVSGIGNLHRLSPNDQRNEIESTLTRLGSFTRPYIRHIVGQSQTRLDFTDIMDTGKIVFVKLSSNLSRMRS